MKFNNILVVCIGNICRSPMAAELLRKNLPEKTISSAGLGALVGHPADALAQECMGEIGVSLKDHRARQIDASMLRQADLVLAMSTDQVQAIERQWPFTRGKVFRLGHWSRFNVADPFQLPKSAFLQARDLIVSGVSDWESKIS